MKLLIHKIKANQGYENITKIFTNLILRIRNSRFDIYVILLIVYIILNKCYHLNIKLLEIYKHLSMNTHVPIMDFMSVKTTKTSIFKLNNLLLPDQSILLFHSSRPLAVFSLDRISLHPMRGCHDNYYIQSTAKLFEHLR